MPRVTRLPQIILDTNVLVSGTLYPGRGPAGAVVTAVLEGKLLPLVSPRLVEEYLKTLAKPRLAVLHRLSDGELRQYVAGLALLSRVVEPPRTALHCPDPRDQHLWDLLAASDAILVTGEHALLRSSDFPGRLHSPREFMGTYLA